MPLPVAYGGGIYGAGAYGGIVPATAPGVPQYRIQIRDHTLAPLCELRAGPGGDWLDGDILLKFNDVGQWVLTVRADASYSVPLQQNLYTAQQADIETGPLSGPAFLTGTGGALSVDSSQAWHGGSSLKVAFDGSGTFQSVSVNLPATAFMPGAQYTVSAYLKAATGETPSLRFYWEGNDLVAGNHAIGSTALVATPTDSGWTRYTVTATMPSSITDSYIGLRLDTGGTPQAVTFYLDGLQLEQAAVATAWVPGGDGTVITVPLAQYFAAGNGVIFSRDRGDGSGAQTILSGPIWHLERRLKDNVYVLSGPDDNFWLKARRAEPGTTPYATVAADAQSGTASTVILHYVNVNAGPGAPAARQVFGLALAADPLVGTSIDESERFTNLLAAIQQHAISGGDIGFRVVQTDVGVLTFSIYQPATQSNAIFSRELGNLLDAVYTLDGPTGNEYVAGGGGNGTARVFVSQDDSTSETTWGRVEGDFIDARDTSDTTVIGQRIAAQLAQDAEQTNLTITPQDTIALQFGRDYNLGDVVSVQIDDTTITDIVRQLHITLNSSDQELVQPGIGNAGAGQIEGLFDAKQRALAAVQRQLSRLKTAQ